MKKVNKLLIFAFISITFQLNATIFYVTPTGSGLMDGSSWVNAAPGNNLQTIIDNSLAGDEVWVSCGTYATTTTLDRTISFSMKNGVTIYGSFQGTESLLSERDISCDPCSILSGEIGVAGIADNSYTVVYNEQLDDTAIIDGFTISEGNDDRSPSSAGNGLGGGLYNHGYNGGFCHPIIRNCLFTNNRASWGGGAFNNGYNGNSEPTYINCVFYQNHAYIEAGGMDSYGVNSGNASPTLINTVFIENTSDTNVGAMYAWGGDNGSSHPVLINCEFINNNATNGYGGAFIADNQNPSGVGDSGTCTVTLQNCIVRGNVATGVGPQFYIRGGSAAQVIATYSNIDLTNQNSPHIVSGAGTGNIDENPLFVNAANPRGIDNCWFTDDDGLQLQSSSTSINAGDNSNTYAADIIGNSRIEETTVDIGAYEYSSTLSIADELLINSSKIYPNPTNNWVTIEQKVKNIDEISIVSITGKRIHLPVGAIIIEENKNRIKLNLQHLSTGTYIIRTSHSADIILKE